ncbi:hypothetical protein BGX31_003777 [Mortierella sp. GBA43]|nr:hypothetical protein BGX31_003777 [Mortierella sp. GBA43]
MMTAAPSQSFAPNNTLYTPSSGDHRRTKSYDPNTVFDDQDSPVMDEKLTASAFADSPTKQVGIPVTNGVRLGRSRSLFRRSNQHGQFYIQGTLPPIPQVPVHQHSGKAASPLLRLEEPILIRIAKNLDINELMQFSHISQRCRAIAAKTMTISLQRTVLKATLCQERKAVFSLEFIFQHLDPASMQAVFRASQLKSRRYFENSALASPVVQALTLVTPHGSHHPIFRLAGYETSKDESMSDRDLERATTLLGRPFELDIKEKGYYRVSPTTLCMVDTPFFPSQPLLDPLVPTATEGAVHGPPSWEMMYKIDLHPPNYPQRVQEQQEKIYQERVRQATLKGEQLPPPPGQPIHSPPAAGFVLPPIKSGPNLRSILPEPSPLSPSDSKSGKLQRKLTVVRPPPEGWGPLPPTAPPPVSPVALAYHLGVRTAHVNGDPTSPTHAVPKSPITGPSCLEPELAEETERFLTLLFIQFPIQTLFPFTANHARKANNVGLMGRLGRSLTMKKT